MQHYTAMLITFLFATISVAAISGEVEDVEQLRAEQIKKWGDTTIPKPKEIVAKAQAMLAKQFSDQSVSELKEVANQSNKAANYVDFIRDKYATYIRDGVAIVVKEAKITSIHNGYARLSDELREYRNQCYLNIGKKLTESGNEIEAFFYFEDAYRLLPFIGPNGDHIGVRYLSEQEMKKLMGLSDLRSFDWKAQE